MKQKIGMVFLAVTLLLIFVAQQQGGWWWLVLAISTAATLWGIIGFTSPKK